MKKLLLILTATLLATGCLVCSGQIPVFHHLPTPEKTEEFSFQENDSIIYTLKLAKDAENSPSYFYSNIFTPVCYTHVCKPVYINLYWDLLGNYIGYDVPPSEPLTKNDHKEFDPENYHQLHDILSNRESILKDYTIYELVDSRTYALSDSVDAVTGATPQTIKNEVIAGAVYTCYTLWHLANGNVVNEIRNLTGKRCDATLLHTFLNSGNHHYQYWAMAKVISENGEVGHEFIADVQSIIEGNNIFTARYALGEVSPAFLSSPSRQVWLWSVYEKSSYALQLAILEKLETVELSDELTFSLSSELQRANEEQSTRIMELLSRRESFPNEVIMTLSEHLSSANTALARRVYDVLTKQNIQSREIKKRMNQFERSSKLTER